MSSSLKKLLLALGILIVVGGIYYFVSQSSVSNEIIGISSVDINSEELARQSEKVVADIALVNSIVIDGAIFDDPRFVSLLDTRIPLADITTGRSNPFAPIE